MPEEKANPWESGDFVGNEREAAPALFHALFEGGFIDGQRVLQKGAVNRHVDDLVFEFVTGAQAHEGHRHFLQVGDVLFEVLERVLDLQCKQAAQALAVFGGGDFGFVEDFDGDRIAGIDQGGEADQGLAGLADFHEFGEFAEGPGGVFLVGGGCSSCGFLSLGGDGVRARVWLRQIGI